MTDCFPIQPVGDMLIFLANPASCLAARDQLGYRRRRITVVVLLISSSPDQLHVNGETWAGYGIKTIDIPHQAPIFIPYLVKVSQQARNIHGDTRKVHWFTAWPPGLPPHAALEPARAALDMKDLLLTLQSAKRRSKSVSGGILNLFKASNELAACLWASGRAVLACTKKSLLKAPLPAAFTSHVSRFSILKTLKEMFLHLPVYV